ncbi:hypothetical protein [uncultured Phycicoccus sp.]|uniref:hypothetical protein n=1 Tax=uncultured Phycicoccus sp. TaxID=661422 RepID=UPI0026110714|nr:hypothetical protein [uncultured Phycicoccus sp.]
MTPHQILERRLTTLAENGTRPPCATDPERWIGDDPTARAFAIFECVGGCPALSECRAAGVTESHGVWGGIDRSKTTRQRKTTAA